MTRATISRAPPDEDRRTRPLRVQPGERPSPGASASPKGLARGVLAAGVVLVSALVVATELQPDPSIAEALDNAHWTLAYATASLLAYLGYRGADPASRQARGFFTLAALAMKEQFASWGPEGQAGR